MLSTSFECSHTSTTHPSIKHFLAVFVILCLSTEPVLANNNLKSFYSPTHSISDSLGIVVTQNTTYLTPGRELEIYLIASYVSKTTINTITIGSTTIKLDKNGVARYTIAAGAIGTHTIPIEVHYTGQDEVVRTKIYQVDYTVGQAMACLSAGYMNTLYIGIDNPIYLTAAATDDKITVSVAGGEGTIERTGPGYFQVRVGKRTDDCKILVYVDGRLVMASLFKTRDLPFPVAYVGGHTSGDSISAGAFRAQQGLATSLADFPFEIRYEIIGYTMHVENDEGKLQWIDNKGASFSSQTKVFMQQHIKPGKVVTIGNLFAKEPSGKVIKLLPLIYTIR